MKRTSMTLSAVAGTLLAAPMATFAQDMPAAEPMPAPAPYVAPAPAPEPAAAASTAPVTPATNVMVQSNIAIPGGIHALSYVPHKYAGKEFAVFQWNQPMGSEVWAAFDSWAANFHLNGGQGELAGYYMTDEMGLGVVLDFNRGGEWTDVTNDMNTPGGVVTANRKSSSDTAFNLDGFQVAYSQPYGDLALYANAHYRSAGNSFSADSSWDLSGAQDTSISDEWSGKVKRAGVTIGTRSFASPNGMAWHAELTWDLQYARPVRGADEVWTHYIQARGRYGVRKDVSGIVFAYGINPLFQYVDGEENPDVQCQLVLPPNMAITVPVFKYWTLKGGASLPVVATYADNTVGDNENVRWTFRSQPAQGNVGLRYGRDRWAVEAGVINNFLTTGPYFISGDQAGGMLVNFALSVDLK